MKPGSAEGNALIGLLVSRHVAVTSTLPVFEQDVPLHASLQPRQMEVMTPQARDYQLLWVDRAGKPLGTLGPVTRSTVASVPSLSPDGTRVVMQRRDAKTARLFARRFRPEFRPAFNAWLATNPFDSPLAPAGPLLMPQYHDAHEELAAKLDEQAGAAFDAGTQARDDGDRYLRNTILLATVLFLTALAPRFKLESARLGLVGVSAVLLGVALFVLGTYPRA